jgi:hypothetical protein
MRKLEDLAKLPTRIHEKQKDSREIRNLGVRHGPSLADSRLNENLRRIMSHRVSKIEQITKTGLAFELPQCSGRVLHSKRINLEPIPK